MQKGNRNLISFEWKGLSTRCVSVGGSVTVQNGVYKKSDAFDTVISAWNELKCNVKSNCLTLSWLSRIFRPLDDRQFAEFHTSRGWTRYKSYKRGP